jgi:hypothetical protein
MNGLIPKSIDLDLLVSQVKGTKRKLDPIRNGIIYILSKITFETVIKERPQHYLHLNHEKLNEIVGKGDGSTNRVKIILDLLINNQIVEYIPHEIKKKSAGYRLNINYRINEFKELPYGQRISEKIQQQYSIAQVLHISSNLNYDYLDRQFELHNLNLHTQLHDDLKSVVSQFLKLISSKRTVKPHCELLLANYIGYIISTMSKIERKEFSASISPSNNRYNSILTNFPKPLRNYLTINNLPAIEIDIKSSQPYFLSVVLNHEFSYSERKGSFNLHSLFPNIQQVIHIFGEKQELNELKLSNKIFGFYFSDEEISNINKFRSIDFTNDFYQFIRDLGGQSISNLKRQNIKKNMMSYLYDDNHISRSQNIVAKILEIEYPSVNLFISKVLKRWSASNFALILQRVESYVIQGSACKNIINNRPSIPLFTIHDALITNEVYGNEILESFRNEIHQITNKDVGLKISSLSPNKKILFEKICEKCLIPSVKEYDARSNFLHKDRILTGINYLESIGHQLNFNINNPDFNDSILEYLRKD